MGEMIMDSKRMLGHLNSLIELDFDAIEAYEAAISRLTVLEDKTQLGRFLADHRRHVTDLTVQEMGGTPATHADFKQILTKGKVLLGSLVGDRAILEAMKSNEDTTSKMYLKASRESGLPLRVRDVLARNCSDEQRHFAWLEQRLALASSSAEQSRRT